MDIVIDMSDIQQDIGELKATNRFLADTMLEVKKSVDKNNDIAQDFREHVTGALATIEQKIVAFADYQVKCENGREIDDGRIGQLEIWQNQEAGAAKIKMAFVATFGGIFGGILGSWDTIKTFFRHM